MQERKKCLVLSLSIRIKPVEFFSVRNVKRRRFGRLYYIIIRANLWNRVPNFNWCICGYNQALIISKTVYPSMLGVSGSEIDFPHTQTQRCNFQIFVVADIFHGFFE